MLVKSYINLKNSKHFIGPLIKFVAISIMPNVEISTTDIYNFYIQRKCYQLMYNGLSTYKVVMIIAKSWSWIVVDIYNLNISKQT